jgi:hypothetical protein
MAGVDTITPGSAHDIMKALQRLMIEHMAARTALTVDAAIGDTVISVANISRFRKGDDIFLIADSLNLAEAAVIEEVLEWDPVEGSRIRTVDPIKTAWAVADGSEVLRAINHQPLKRVFLGDQKQIPDFPSISISLPSETNEWWTLRATTHEYTFKIRGYILADNFETGAELITKFGDYIKEVLIDHIHPLVDDPPTIVALTADLFAGDTVVEVTSTADINEGNRVYLRDGQVRPGGSQEAVVRSILSPTELRLGTAVEFDFLVAREAELIAAQRYIYDSRPSSVNYGFVPATGGSFAHAVEINYFAKEALCRVGNLIT